MTLQACQIDVVFVLDNDIKDKIVSEKTNDTCVYIKTGLVIDSNMVKNFRNRLTAAALRFWNNSLGSHAVQIEEHPRLPKDRKVLFKPIGRDHSRSGNTASSDWPLSTRFLP